MRRLSLIIFCILATFALGYTTYAATIKKPENKPLSKNPKDIQERILKSRINFLQNFSSTTLQLLPAVDVMILRDEIKQISLLDSKSINKSASSTRSINESQILLTSKISFLNMYVNYLKNSPKDTKSKKVSKANLISNELVHKVVIATSTRAIQELQKDFINTNILKIKKSEIPKNKITNKVGHPAVQPPRTGKKFIKTATSTEPVIISTPTTTPDTTTPEQETVMATSTATTTEPVIVEATTTPVTEPTAIEATTTPVAEEVVTSSSTEMQ